ncbi:hypothetical protein F5876DRAFT_75945 [Lentinula aff. lateritia]|uniref:Uncharacterized protein n=1 Tax=Lentinula aff. lateritia TaxID=2804960 RepID=A0ACC1U3Y0_9AGAR|nr:hypothetical protein F5876DRAFT_75945 [Lentinula aff. lateritia]
MKVVHSLAPLPSQFSDSHKATGNGYGYLSSYPTLVLGLADLHELLELISEHLDVETPFVFSNGDRQETLITLFALSAKLVAHSAKLGATPPGVSPLFGPLLFGLGALPSDLISVSSSSIYPSAVPPPSAITSSSSTSTIPDRTFFESTYTSYLRSVHATEHCLLSFIRWQDTPTSLGGGGSGAGVLAIADLLGSGGFRNREQHSLGLRKGAQTIRVLPVRRTVPVYDRDLVRSSAKWGLPSYAAVEGGGFNSLPGNKEWGRMSPPVQVSQGNIISNGGCRDKGRGGKMPVRYSDSYRKKMNIPPGVEPRSSPYALPLSALPSSSSSYSFSFHSSSPVSSSPTSPSTSHPSAQSSRFKTLADAHWGQFESPGLLSPPSSSARGSRDIESAPKFDHTESARRTQRGIRDSVDWGEFVNGGFDLSEQRRSGGESPVALSSSTNSSHLNNNGYGYDYGAGDDPDKSYVGADGRLIDVGEFTLDTGLDAALQFNLSEFGIIGSGKDRDKDGKEGKEVRGEREKPLLVSLAFFCLFSHPLPFLLPLPCDPFSSFLSADSLLFTSSTIKRIIERTIPRKPLPPFTYDSTPLLLPGSETLIEAAFVDVWTDLVSWGLPSQGWGLFLNKA